jgi:mRNA-degrading endonuclease RelE of RelBE toxin-antitoxin system
MFILEFTDRALEDLHFLEKSKQSYILDVVELQLTREPHVQTRNRKRLRPNDLAVWELRAGTFRVFYDIEGTVVWIKAVGWKEHNRLLIRGREFKI